MTFRPFQPRLRLLTLLIAAGFPGSYALAQAQPGPAHSQLRTLNVTAKGHAAEALETPAAVLVLDREDLFQRGAANVGEALRGAPGLAVASDGAQGQNPVIRGLKRESVVLLVDGMRLNSAQPAGAIASFMSLGLADSVEVVRGPASVLYGTGALGGVVNVRLPQAEFTPGLRFRASAGYDSASQGLRAAGILNASQGDHALMLGLAPSHQDDYRAPGGKVADTGYRSASAIAQYRFRIDAAQQLRVSLQQHVDQDVWYPGSAKPGMPPSLGIVTVHSPRQERSLAEVGYSFQGHGDWRLDARLYRQSVYREVRAFASALGRDQADTRVRFVTDGVDLKADWAGLENHLLTFGLNVWEMSASPERYLNNNPPLFNNRMRNDPFSDGRIRAQGLYVQDDMHFGRLGVLAGLRFDRVTGNAASINNGAVTNGLSRSDSATSASLGLVYEVAPLLRPYANLSRAFRAGEMRERFEASPRGDGFFYLGNPQIRPEQATQFEVGLKGEDERFGYTLSAYRTRITDFITGRVTGAVQAGLPVKRTENIGRVTLQGLEAEGRWQFTRGHSAKLGYSRIRAGNDDLGEPLFQSPADELSLGWEGRVAPGWSADATLRLVRAQDRVATRFTNGTENTTPGFATADVGVTYRWQQQSLRFAIRNLADKAYHEHLAEGLSGREIQAPGRSLAIHWKGEF
ncbi:TonB-dependent receptor [Ramlibacter sp.]|uniref:TonB-dependent receptor n=1 Tax=Ramlibacter sp. TaxID=1917967 RepID=UPI002D377A8D|nr:TonB-dependent receptor [Ramlibacter sp.]HYD75958.1 TonB-dependent receptor [Ramlibacter sp.]